MQFNHPEILAFLFLLIIPILIHLFQLQRFKKEAFTNVKFLQEIELESRRSSKIKKLLILATRLLALACLILAFAQPVLKKSEEEERRKTVVYLDNSLSMQAKDQNGAELLQGLKRMLIEDFEVKSIDMSLITNEKLFDNLDPEGFKQEVLNLGYHPTRKDLSQVLLEAGSLARKNGYPGADVFLFSDFRNSLNIKDSLSFDLSNTYNLIPVRSEPFENLVLDSLWMGEFDRSDNKIRARISSQSIDIENLSVSLVLNGQLFGKTSQEVKKGSSSILEFSIPTQITGNGAMTFTDPRLAFDNTLFFTLPKKINPKVLVIGKRSGYLSRIYKADSFELQFSSLDNLDQGSINDYDLVLVNELQTLPTPLVQSLKAYAKELGNLVIIAASDPDMFSYQALLTSFGMGRIVDQFDRKKLVNTVNYAHPFFQNVFKGQVTNFEYPQVNSGLLAEFNASSTLLGFDDGTAFISEVPYGDNSVYWVSSPLEGETSDFKDSPLIVPVFFNFSLPENKIEGLYSVIGRRNELVVQNDSLGESALKLVYGNEEFIPLQKSTSRTVTLYTKEYPISPGIYQVKDGDRILSEQAFNYDRNLVRTDYQDLSYMSAGVENVSLSTSTQAGVRELNALFSSRTLWQLFTIFVLFFIFLEMLIQKFVKN